ncbi:P-loop containing nucleoside triphosphate hydrolase protein [Violaceomyces palustris]|uniref:P-loop containing nucleoside triphosphate hydrolase protein n=1 Tax=Violaceomyces palustris TaxID=1673888 RepID=A0ACD0NXX4_9BASI|nr:P-loop containing nucleoside triphosphate hydrolase protein [Violaceomyces palustris]
MVRSYPNIVITGTPGTGKSTHSSLLASTYQQAVGASTSPLRVIDVGKIVKEKQYYLSYDEEWQSYEVNEDQLLDELEPLSGGRAPDPLEEGNDGGGDVGEDVKEAREKGLEDETRGGLILDWHTCDAWPERWVDLVVVLRCDHQILWERLEKRNYPLNKIKENNEAEIMAVVTEEARSSYPQEAVVELRSQESEDLEENVERIIQWIKVWRQQRGLED